MKKTSSIILLAALLASPISFSGCATAPTPQSIETKSKAIAFIATAEVLKKNPTLAPQFTLASGNLKFLAAQETIDVATVLGIVNGLPALQGGDVYIYVTGGILFFGDAITQWSANNPEQIRSAAKGLYEGIDMALGGVAPASVLAPPQPK